MPTIESIMGEIATEAAEGKSVGYIDRASAEELNEVQEQAPRRPIPSVWDMQRKAEVDHIMGRGSKPLDGSCRDRHDNGVLDD